MMSESFKIEERRDGRLSCVRISGACELDVGRTFDCGQCFRFDRVADSRYEVEYRGVAFGRAVSFASEGGELYVIGANAEEFDGIWRNFLSLDEDYQSIHGELLSLSKNPALSRAVEYGRGIRILRQDPWEAICSFIISQNNNIPRIKGLIGALSERVGEPISDGVYAFPTPEAVVSLGVEGLRALKMGFRAPYIIDAAQKVASGELDLGRVASLPTPDAENELRAVKGIGPKVADCALLFGFSKYDAFPIDVWMKRVIEKYFDPEFEPASLGRYAGIAQQVLFYYERWTANSSEEKTDRK